MLNSKAYFCSSKAKCILKRNIQHYNFLEIIVTLIKFIYSEEATKFCEISTIDLSYGVPVKSTVESSQNFVAFSEYINFNIMYLDHFVPSQKPFDPAIFNFRTT